MSTRAILVLAAGLLAACGSERGDDARQDGGRGGPGGEDAATRIVPHVVAFALEERTVEAVGTARAKSSATVRPDTGGVVDAVLFAAGDLVDTGAPLIRLEAAEEQLALNLARVAAAEAEQLLERYRRIEDTGAVSDSAIDEARTVLESARIRRSQAELALERRTVRAPFAGYVGLTDIDPGARVTTETAITQLDDRSALYADFAVPEEVYGQVRPGGSVEVVPFGGANARMATIAALDSRIDPVSRSFTARAALDNADDALRPGMSFRVRFGVPGQSYPAVPEAAIVWGSDGAYLWAVREGVAARVPVGIVARREGTVLVSADLAEGEVIVAEGVQKVREGGLIETAFEPAPAPPQPTVLARPEAAESAGSL